MSVDVVTAAEERSRPESRNGSIIGARGISGHHIHGGWQLLDKIWGGQMSLASGQEGTFLPIIGFSSLIGWWCSRTLRSRPRHPGKAHGASHVGVVDEEDNLSRRIREEPLAPLRPAD